MKKFGNILWGIVLIAVGVLLALKAFDLIHFEIFFDGWWTLFIIVPCFIGLFTEREKTGNIVGLCIGVFLLLCCQEVFGFDKFWKLIFPIVIVIIGLKLIFGAFFRNDAAEVMKVSRKNGVEIKSGCAVFSGKDMNFGGEVFSGAEATAVFGGVKCDLRNAIIEKDCAITATAIFGGIDIYVPENVNVKVNSNSVFGGVSEENHRPTVPGVVTVYINATCVFGGIEIK